MFKLSRFPGGKHVANVVHQTTGELICKAFYSDEASGSNPIKEIILDPDEKFESVPFFDCIKEKDNQIYLLFGKKRSGKGYFSHLIAKQYHDVYPKNKIMVFTNQSNIEHKSQDDLLSLKGVKHFDLTTELAENFPSAKVFKNCLVVFDDCDNIRNVVSGESDDEDMGKGTQPEKEAISYPMANMIAKLKNELLEVGAKANVWVIVTCHNVLKGKKDTEVRSESDYFVFFRKTQKHQKETVMEKYMQGSFNKKTVDRILKMKSRWVLLPKDDNYILAEREAFIID